MFAAERQSLNDRVGSALAALLVQGAFACLFLWGLGSEGREKIVEPLKMFHIFPDAPEPEPIVSRPPPREPSETRNKRFTPREEGGSSPPNLRSQASPVVAPRPVVELPVRPIVAAPVAGTGNDPSQGAALVRGPGTGSGGLGNGTGSGIGGGGPGGGGYSDYQPPRQIRGRLRDSDYPAGLGEGGIHGTVGVIFTVLANGRVTNCRVRSSSGSRVLDLTTCDLIERRFFYEPSRDPYGRPVDSQVVENHSWIVEDDPEQPEPPRRRRRLF